MENLVDGLDKVYSNLDCKFKSTCQRYINGNHYCEGTKEVCKRYLKLYWLYKNSMLSENQYARFICKNLDNGADNDAYMKLKAYENNITDNVNNGNSLYLLSSNFGNGKTSWAVRLMQDYMNSLWCYAGPDTCSALFINVPKYLIELKKSFTYGNSEYLDHVNKHIYTVPLVVFDEIGSKVGSDYDKDILLYIINERINNGKCNIYTSNSGKAELESYLGKRIVSRVFGCSEIIVFNGVDKRGIIY